MPLRVLFRKLTEGVALDVDFKVLGAVRALPSEWEKNVFRIAQEVPDQCTSACSGIALDRHHRFWCG